MSFTQEKKTHVGRPEHTTTASIFPKDYSTFFPNLIFVIKSDYNTHPGASGAPARRRLALAWLNTLPWGNFTGEAQVNLTGARRFLNLLGDHTTKDSRESTAGRVSIIAAQVGAGFEKAFSDFTFPPSLLTQQIVSWLCGRPQAK